MPHDDLMALLNEMNERLRRVETQGEVAAARATAACEAFRAHLEESRRHWDSRDKVLFDGETGLQARVMRLEHTAGLAKAGMTALWALLITCAGAVVKLLVGK